MFLISTIVLMAVAFSGCAEMLLPEQLSVIEEEAFMNSAIEEIIANEPKPAPRFVIDPSVKDFYAFTRDSFAMENYQYSDFTGKIPVAV